MADDQKRIGPYRDILCAGLSKKGFAPPLFDVSLVIVLNVFNQREDCRPACRRGSMCA